MNALLIGEYGKRGYSTASAIEGSHSHKAVVQEVVGAGIIGDVSHKQRLALGYALCGKGLKTPSLIPRLLQLIPVSQELSRQKKSAWVQLDQTDQATAGRRHYSR